MFLKVRSSVTPLTLSAPLCIGCLTLLLHSLDPFTGIDEVSESEEESEEEKQNSEEAKEEEEEEEGKKTPVQLEKKKKKGKSHDCRYSDCA